MKPRWYQDESVAAVWNHLCTQQGNPVVVLPTGAGKSLVIAMLCRDAVQRFNGRVIVLAHRKELLQQNAEKIRALLPDMDVGIYSAGLNSRDTDHDIVLAGIQSVYERAGEFGSRQMILADECFTGETLISTPNGERRIDNMRCGDTVYCANGVGVVLATSCMKSNEIYEVKLSNGTTTVCTGSHKWFTENGWRKASALAVGEVTYSIEDVCALWESVPSVEEGSSKRKNKSVQRGCLGKASLLLSILCEETQQPNEQASSQDEGTGEIKRNEIQAYQARRQRAIASLGSACVATCTGRWVGSRSRCSNRIQSSDWKGDVSNKLQDRHCEQEFNDRNRGRRSVSCVNCKKRSGRKEKLFTSRARVVSVSRIKRDGPETVFNLHVSGHPSYFANGSLVHNCHLVPSDGEGMYKTFLGKMREINPKLRMVGLTATPFRTGEGKLCRPDALFQSVCYEASIKRLINEGYLCNLITATADNTVDTSGLHIRAGEFIPSEMAALFDDEAKIKLACQELVSKTQGRKSTLIFCSGVHHAESVAETLQQLTGEECGLVVGDMPPIERAATLIRFRSGELKRLCNCDILTTGFDSPKIDAIGVLRATASPGLFAQICGRGLRIAEGKEDCVILDFGSNVKRHGPLDHPDYGKQSKGGGKGGGDAPTKVCPNCEEELHLSATECECGFEFPRQLARHETQAGSDQVLSGNEPVVEWVVDEISLARHKKKGGTPDDPDTLRIDYICHEPGADGNLARQRVSEWVCLEHDGYAGRKAQDWWLKRCLVSANGIDDAIELWERGAMATPSMIRTKKDGKWLRVVGYDLDPIPERDEWREVGESVVDVNDEWAMDDVPF